MKLSFARDTNNDKDLIKKTKNTTSRSSIKGGDIVSRIKSITDEAKERLKHHQDEYITIRDIDTLKQYIKDANKAGICALDTETTGLNPITDKIVGVCLYTPAIKACYIPINHKSYVTGIRSSNQLTAEEVSETLNTYTGKWLMHNAKFDIRVMRNSLGYFTSCYWDTQVAAHLIDENESHALKDLHLKYCNSVDTESLTFASLFSGITFDNVPIDIAVLYAAGDAKKTYELYEYQKTILNRRNLPGPYYIFNEIEMPLINIVSDIEDRGVALDYAVCKTLHDKYSDLLKQRKEAADKAVDLFKTEIENHCMRKPKSYLRGKINVLSPQQLAELLYDVLKLESPEWKKPRGTGENILSYYIENESNPKIVNLCKAILDYREVNKLLSTYIDKIPSIALDGVVHAEFLPLGTVTGRFSSKDPNLQNIPSHNKEIRKMFRARDGYVLIGADYSAQEPRITAHLSHDTKMINAFNAGRDIYAEIASLVFHKPYEECLEKDKNGNKNPPEYAERRSQTKSVVLGVLYGRQIKSIAKQLDISKNDAQKIYNKIMDSFPELAQFLTDSLDMARTYGYVDTIWGRHRRLPDLQLPTYEFSYVSESRGFDPLTFTEGEEVDDKVPESTVAKYTKMLNNVDKYSQKSSIIEMAKKNDGIKIIDNSVIIADAERQCVNSRVQGSAADLTKLAMINIANDEILKKMDFHLLITIHDEVIGECPEKYANECNKRLEELMCTAAKGKLSIPLKADCEVTKNWYGEKIKL